MQSYGVPLPRITFASVAAVMITAVLFLIMNGLIRHDGDVPEPRKSIRITEIVRMLDDRPIDVFPHIEPPQKVEPPPPISRISTADPMGDVIGVDVAPPTVESGPIGIQGGLPDGDMLPIVKVAPAYPSRAAMRGIEGYVLLEFAVDESGRVVDPHVLKSHPVGIFDKSALRAVLRFKYKPRVLNGQPIRVEGVLHRLTFELSGS